jgi:hypothetical protein
MKTVSLELAKELKEAGYPQDTYFQWFEDGSLVHTESRNPLRCIAAPIADEILDLLPAYTALPFFLYIWKDDKGLYRIVYCSSADLVSGGKQPNYPVEKQKSLAEAAGLMWLYLKKNELM